MSSIAVLIPAHNEADRIAETVKAARLIEGVTEIIVIDDGSTDTTVNEAHSAEADKVIEMFANSGKGRALMSGLKRTDADVLLLLDGDLGASASSAGVLLEPVVADQADMTIAILPSARGSGGFGFAVGLARWGIHRFTGRTMQAPLSGQRALKREIVEKMGGFDPGFGVETGLTIDAIRMGYRVEEVPAALAHRATGKDIRGFIHRGRQFKDIARALIVRLLRRGRYKSPS